MSNITVFLLGFTATWTPILIYTAWLTWRISEVL
jgi:hypothetical protein